VATGKELLARNLQIPCVLEMAFSPDGTTLATGGFLGVIQLWDLATGKQKRPLGGHQAGVLGVAVSPDGRIFATAGGDKLIRLWDSTSGKETRQLVGHAENIWSLAFVPDGRLLMSTEFGETVRVWNGRCPFSENGVGGFRAKFFRNWRSCARAVFLKLLAWTPSSNSNRMSVTVGSTSIA
jgi:WD40 repeat protein